MAELEDGHKWWIRYVIVPLLTCAGIGALITAYVVQPRDSPPSPSANATPGLPAFSPSPIAPAALPAKPTQNPTAKPTPRPTPKLPKLPPSVITVIIDAKRVNRFLEFKAESTATSELATGHITTTGSRTWTWDMKKTNQRIWFWWDNLDGEADLMILSGNTVLFDGVCSYSGTGEIKVKNSSPIPRVYKISGSPRLKENPNRSDTDIEF